MQSEKIEYEFAGQRHVGHLALPDSDGARAGVLLCHEGFGIDEHATGHADRLAAELGVVAFALDYYGGGRRVSAQEMGQRLGVLSQEPDQIRALGYAGLNILLAQSRVDRSRVAAIGFCFGGTMALELARAGADLAAVVGFHSGLNTASPAAPGSVRGSVLVCIGADDPFIPPSQRAEFEEEMQKAGADWRISLYGGAVHSFTSPAADARGMDGIAYHETAHRRSWAEMSALLSDALA
jgi:dienelactone hydrolase